MCVTADYAASNCTEFTIVGGRVLYITSFKFEQKIDKQSKIILKIPNLTVPCCHSELNIDDTAWWVSTYVVIESQVRVANMCVKIIWRDLPADKYVHL